MKVIILENEDQVAITSAKIISDQIKNKPNSVLGLATGSTPIKTYQQLIKMYQDKEISFKNITAFNLDEYKDIDPNNDQSYHYFMDHQLFNFIDINKNNCYIPNASFYNNPQQYDELIKKFNGIDLQLLGLGINGHIGFNEPNTSFDSLTQIVDLTQSTIKANSRFFDSIELVPTKAISMGLKSIMNARKILLLATGINKADAIFHLIEDKITPNWPCSILQNHNDVTIIIDKNAASKLTKKKAN
ncbi:glucosamine-6-phosphate deaminase [Mycoplasma feriruminatoris]|uniref:glucosamine-6-phosphate deaminase n=1 Tax=Mycoplasma feriruminatoris TaxID=1179777 RepID=UPI0002A4F7BA|nr:glucosamine-6-phosphate deaminase [Mycoplasma feriruminatoris]UKS53830.1 glucosamine-6-phosphate deaminase [Mycoplasma feriruminatoris]VZK65017.1 Glucosamine-6-phosphate deaminase 1 [Mycoplasma feriruminatoris]VZR75160.1 Glucosamine-6-phosphate deaminase 1 [Mycoplasma feriruminatoris]VZR97126.1 Glucosamine-6-phosphate deaminase 1 [Mycoplasma feriruminatoris]